MGERDGRLDIDDGYVGIAIFRHCHQEKQLAIFSRDEMALGVEVIVGGDVDREKSLSRDSRLVAAVLSRPRVRRLLSREHFSVDGTLIEAWASMKSFKPKGSQG
ncbi:hypothetical protein [Shumkonia mesophila]